MLSRKSVAMLVAGVFLLGIPHLMSAADAPSGSDFCEFATAKDATAFGWDTEAVNGAPTLEVTSDCKVGRSALMARGKDFMGDWGTLVLKREINLSGAKKTDKIVFFVKQNVASGLYLNIDGVYRTFPVTRGEWTRVELDMDPAKWTWGSGHTEWGRFNRFAFYARTFTNAEQFILLDGLSFHIGGKTIPASIPPNHMPKPKTMIKSTTPTLDTFRIEVKSPPQPVSDAWVKSAAAKALPTRNAQAWLLGNAQAVWAVSRQNGSIIGGWNVARSERCLDRIEGAYYLEDKSRLFNASENNDAIFNANLDEKSQALRLTCTNASLKGVGIIKVYSVHGNTLTREISFASGSNMPLFISYRSEAYLEPGFRREGNYVGAGSFGPIEAAAEITGEKQPMFYTNSRGMILSNHVRDYSLAHFRSKLDGRFVLPWWSYSRAESAKDCFYYTATGWKLPFGISSLKPGATVSYEENLTLSAGNYHDFVTRDYAARTDVREDLESLGAVPTWLADLKVMRWDNGAGGRAYEDFNRLKRIVELTDDGYILVMAGLTGQNWADYYVDKGLVGMHGGWISGPEFRKWMRKIKAISPRIKLGIYCYMDAAGKSSRLYKQHPEWFRATDKEGNDVNHFSGVTGSSTSMFNNPECRQAILAQFDLLFDHLGFDYVYLDDALTNNLVNWETGEVLRDDDCYDFFRGIREIAARHGPDKAVFFNGQGNPYGDINFIEAYTRLAADFWRPFAGVSLGVETFLINRPNVRVTPLYWTKPLNREYANRILALGWVPALEYTEDVDSRPFISAAYEIGNIDPVNADYQPDWRKEKDIKIESYAVRRLGDKAITLSLISYEDKPQMQRVKIRLDNLGLDSGKPLYVWSYRIKDATQYRGHTSEKAAKTIYTDTAWTVDLITAPECRYAGRLQNQFSLEVELRPSILSMLTFSNEVAAVRSIDNLPMNFLFSKARGVNLDSRVDQTRKEVIINVDSQRDTCEITAFIPVGWRVKNVLLDGKKTVPHWTVLGDMIAPLIRVPRGRRAVRVQCEDANVASFTLAGISATLNRNAVEIKLPDKAGEATKALFTVTQDDLVLFSSMVEKDRDAFLIPVAPQSGGVYEVQARALLLPDGLARVQATPAQVRLPEVAPVMALTPINPGVIPAHKEIREINRTVRGVQVLRAATETTATTLPPFQTDLKALTVNTDPDKLMVDVGTTHKVEGYLGAAFGGFEIKDMRTARIHLKNTYFGASHADGTNIHSHKYYYTARRMFAGFMVDYHTAAGYTKRVALGVGVLDPDCRSPFPSYGRGAKPDQLVDLGPIVQEGPEKEFVLDLNTYAPEGWDGQVWFSVGSDWALPGRRLNAQILATNEAHAADALKGKDTQAFRKIFLAKRQVRVPRATSPVVLDGKLDENAWKGAASTDEFFLVGGKGYPIVKTMARLTYDDNHLYVSFVCEEKARKKPLVGKGSIWYDDEVEIYLDTDGTRKSYKQVIINAGGDTMEFVRPGGKTNIGTKVRTSAEAGRSWTIEAAIPFKGLGKTPAPGDIWSMNLCRFHPEGRGFALETITWAPTMHGFGGKEMDKFNDLIFQ